MPTSANSFQDRIRAATLGECVRLLTNCIIYYNMVLLSQLAVHKERRGDAQGGRHARPGLAHRVAAHQFLWAL